MKRRGFLGLAAGALAVSLAGLPAMATDMTLRIGGTGSTESADHKAITIFKDELERRTNGQVTVTIFPSSQLGTYREMLEQIRAGTLDGMYESLGIVGPWHPVAGLEAVPYLYRDVDHFFSVWNGEVGAAILENVAQESKFRVLGPAFRGFRQMALNQPVHKIDDLQGLKFRAPAIPAYMDAFKALGGAPTPIAFEEVYTAVQQGVVEGLENPLVTIHDHRFYEVAHYAVMTGHMAETMGFIFSEDWFQKQPEEYQDALVAAAKASSAWYRQFTEENEAKFLVTLQEKGMTVIEPDLTGFHERAKAYDPGPDLSDWVQQIRAVR